MILKCLTILKAHDTEMFDIKTVGKAISNWMNKSDVSFHGLWIKMYWIFTNKTYYKTEDNSIPHNTYFVF